MYNFILAYSAGTYTDSAAVLGTGLIGLTTLLVIFSFFFYLLIMGISILGLVFWILMIIDAAQRNDAEFPEASANSKVIWLLIILLTSYIGAGIYYFLVYKKLPRKKKILESK